MEIKGILVSILAPLENHIANGGEKLLGNASSIKKTPDGKVYISGQMQRHALFTAMERLNDVDPNKGDTFVSNGDGVTNQIEKDLRGDMGGFMHPSRGDYSGRRSAPLTATMAVSISSEKGNLNDDGPSKIGRDLLIRIRQNEGEEATSQALATREFSEFDLMNMSFFLDLGSLSISKGFTYEGSFHVSSEYFKHVKEDERKRRATLFLNASCSINDYSNQARNAVSGEPQQVLIVFDTKLSRKASRYFTANAKEQQNILQELKERGAEYFLGNDAEGNTSVAAAYKQALAMLESSTLYDPCGGDEKIVTFEEFAGQN